jgi:hypothetical protein
MAHYREGLALAEKLAGRDASFPKWQALHSFFLGGVGRTALRIGDFASARRFLADARAVLLALQSRQNLTPEQNRWAQDFEQDLAAVPPP